MKKLILLLILQLPLFSFANEVWMRYPSISPDGQYIAFAYQGDLFLVDSKGGDAKQLTSHAAHDFMPVWSSDSKTIAFASNRHGNFDVFIVAREGGVPTRLTHHSSNDYPYDFKPGDKEVVYMSGRLDTRSS
ncbi:MAG: peptidase S41, partial [Flavobacteriia bacterium]